MVRESIGRKRNTCMNRTELERSADVFGAALWLGSVGVDRPELLDVAVAGETQERSERMACN